MRREKICTAARLYTLILEIPDLYLVMGILVILNQVLVNFLKIKIKFGDRGGTVVKVLCYKSEGRCFDPRWCHWNFSLT